MPYSMELISVLVPMTRFSCTCGCPRSHEVTIQHASVSAHEALSLAVTYR
jgi:hypothetical protein